MSTGLTAEEVYALEVARQLIALGVRVFAAAPVLDADGEWMPKAGADGYRLPRHWQRTVPTTNWLDPSVPGFEYKAWRPGWALCAVMGHAFDAVDCDPRNGGDVSRAGLVSEGVMPTVYATATTPSGGTHELVRALGIASRDGFLPGLDYKGGKPDGSSRGFVFIAPTAKRSKVTGEIGTYAWTSVDLDAFDPEDSSGKALAEVVRPSRRAAAPTPAAPVAAPVAAPAGDAETARLEAYTQTVRDEEVHRLDRMHEAATPRGVGYRGEGWDDGTYSRACNLLELANSEWSSYTVEMAYADVMQHAPTDEGFTSEKVNKKWEQAVSTVGDRGRPYPVARQDTQSLVASWATEPDVRVDPALTADQSPAPDEDFWDELPILAHIRDFAHARLCAPFAVLAVVLARVVANVPPHVMLPAIVGGRASLNGFYALVGASGTGKGAAEAAAADAVDVGPVEVSSVGSGEGIAHLYAHREKREVVRDRESVLFSVPEVDTLTALGDRRGATLLPQLRSAWIGEQIGFSYADPTKALRIPAHSYRLSLVLGVQPGRAGALLDDADGGTPQRFCWAPTTDPRIPERATAPAPIRLDPQLWPSPSAGPCELVIPEVAEKAIRCARLATMRGEGDPLDGHALLCQLKLAAALTLLDGRRVVTADDWRRADVLMAVSRRTRESVQQYLARQASTANVARGRAEGQRLAVASEAHDDLATRRVARRLTDHLRQHGEASRSEARRRLPGRDRPFFDEAVARLVEAGQVVVCETEHGERLRAIA